MKKLSLLIALILCVGCVLLTSCDFGGGEKETDDVQDTVTEAVDNETESDTTEGGNNNDQGGNDEGGNDEGGNDQGDATTSENDAYADDIFTNIPPVVIS